MTLELTGSHSGHLMGACGGYRSGVTVSRSGVSKRPGDGGGLGPARAMPTH